MNHKTEEGDSESEAAAGVSERIVCGTEVLQLELSRRVTG